MNHPTTRPALAVFDMIGTTVRDGPEVHESFAQAFAEDGIALTAEAVEAVRGRSKREGVEALVTDMVADSTERELRIETIYTRFQGLLLSRYRAGVEPVPGAHEVLASLIASGIPVVLTTGLDRETARAILTGLQWDDLGIAGLLTGDDVARGRPAPDLIRAAMALGGLEDPSRVLVVGDTAADLEAAAQARAGWSVGVTSGAHSRELLERHPHTAILDSVAELPTWLAR